MRSPPRRLKVSSETSSRQTSSSACHASSSWKCSGGQNGNGPASPRKLVALEPEEVAKAPVDRADPTFADEQEPVGNRGEQRANLVPLTVERRREAPPRRAAEPEHEEPREGKREGSGGCKPQARARWAASRTDTTAAAPAVNETASRRTSSFVRVHRVSHAASTRTLRSNLCHALSPRA